jgi:prepilin-type N-terminal cleavage/methylation domain-containing protein
MDERGFTLVELLVGMLVLVVVMLATLQVLDDSTRISQRDNERAAAIQDAQVGLDRMVRELRHATTVAGSATVLMATIQRRGVTTANVIFNCDPANVVAGVRRCTRQVGAGTPEVLVNRVRGTSPVFTYTGSPPKFVRVRLEVAPDGGKVGGYRESVIYTDGTGFRNVP